MTSERNQLLLRIADALDRLAPPAQGDVDWLSHPAYIWRNTGARAISSIEAPDLDQLRGIDRQKRAVFENIARLAAGYAGHDMLLWGARGMGKSALVRSAVRAVQKSDPKALALVQIATDGLDRLAELFLRLGRIERQFLIFIDDLGFGEQGASEARQLRSWLDGGVEARPANLRLAVTANRRAIVERQASEQDGALNPRDALDDQLALADRFGLSLGFHACSQEEYLAIVSGYAEVNGLEWDRDAALEWAKRRGSRSGRTAWQFITELAGHAGQAL